MLYQGFRPGLARLPGTCPGPSCDVGLDCICPIKRPPGEDTTDLAEVARLLDGRTAFYGNVHTVQSLIQGKPEDVRTEAMEILDAFQGSRRLIIGTGNQVGRETPEENIHAMIETARLYRKTVN